MTESIQQAGGTKIIGALRNTAANNMHMMQDMKFAGEAKSLVRN